MSDGFLLTTAILCGLGVVVATVFAAKHDRRTLVPSWADIEKRFRELDTADVRAVAGQVMHRDDWLLHWWVTAKAQRADVMATCELAGTKLRADAKITLKPATRLAVNDVDRWFMYLVDEGLIPREKADRDVTLLPGGNAEPAYITGVNVCRVSMQGCVKALQRDVTPA